MRAGISGQSTLKTIAKSAAAAFALALSAAAGGTRFAGPADAGLMAEPREREASGLAPSRLADGVFWTHNDSRADPVAFAVDARGRRRGSVRLADVKPEDWEDVASFELDGRAWLLIADCGDNFANRPSAVLHVLTEPEPSALAAGRVLARAPEYSIHFVYEDGPRDCEAVAVDPAERAVWLLTKRDVPARLYRLPLAAAGARQPAVARFAGPAAGIVYDTDSLRRRLVPARGAVGGWPTALDFSPDGSLAVVLTLTGPALFPRAPGESWAAALARPPTLLAEHHLPQAEAACFSRDGRSLYVCSELTLRWLRYDRRD